MRDDDVEPLFTLLSDDAVARHMSPTPVTREHVRRFVAWARQGDGGGRHAGFVATPPGSDAAAGVFQVRPLDPGRGLADWGFALGVGHWGSGLFAAAAPLVVDFAVARLGVRRLEARTAVANGRGNGALAKVGATCEAVLRQSFRRRDRVLDQALWTILAEDWTDRRGGAPRDVP
ncbi:MAG: GNAT family N-acetyltransferase [Vicinamibacterales bacterium]